MTRKEINIFKNRVRAVAPANNISLLKAFRIIAWVKADKKDIDLVHRIMELETEEAFGKNGDPKKYVTDWIEKYGEYRYSVEEIKKVVWRSMENKHTSV